MILRAAALGRGRYANRTPTGPTPSPTVATPASTIAVRVEGRVIDGDREAPVPGAIITLAEVTADGRYQQPNQAGSANEGRRRWNVCSPYAWISAALEKYNVGGHPRRIRLDQDSTQLQLRSWPPM